MRRHRPRQARRSSFTFCSVFSAWPSFLWHLASRLRRRWGRSPIDSSVIGPSSRSWAPRCSWGLQSASRPFSQSTRTEAECYPDPGRPPSRFKGPHFSDPLLEGTHVFHVKAVDSSAIESEPATHTWTIDLTAPNTNITAAPSDPSNAVNPNFSFTSSEGGSSFECKLDSGAFAACTSPKSY